MDIKTLLKWGGRVVIVIGGIIAIATGVSPPHIAAIVTGVAAIFLAVYATIRDLSGTIEASDDQIVGLVDARSTLDWIVFAILVVVVVVIWIVNP